MVSSIALAVTLVFALDGKFNNHEGKIYIIWPKHLLKDHSIITSAKKWSEVGWWGQKTAIFADLQYYLC